MLLLVVILKAYDVSHPVVVNDVPTVTHLMA